MVWVASMVMTVALLLSADASGLLRARASSQAAGSSQTQVQDLPSLPPPSSSTTDPAEPTASPAKTGPRPSPKPDRQTPNATKPAASVPAADASRPAAPTAGPLKEDSRLSLVRYIDGELVQVVRSIPAGKKGFHMKAGVPLNETALRMAVASAGSAINPGDRAQITNLDFKDKEIIIEVNGGGKGHTRLRDRIHLEVGGVPTMTTTPDTPVNTNAGATIFLDFDKSLPDMSADDLKEYLSGVLDFSQRHSAAVQWVETLPPEIQKAIQDKQPVVGMDHDMVLAAMGRPDRKVREKGADGSEIEDWIYGTPPEKTIFVSFEGDKVTQIHQYPQ